MKSINSVVTLDRVDGIAILRLDSPPVNALGLALREGILAGIAAALDGGARAIVLICEGRTFCAGADIAEFGKPLVAPLLPEDQAAIEASPVPVIAAIHGTALGGGLELALACHYRLAVPSASLGLPEVSLGLLPGAGGTQRLPRIVGVARALDMMTSGKPVSATTARELGIVDALAREGHLLDDAIAFARKVEGASAPLPRVRDRKVADTPEEAAAAIARLRQQQPRLFQGFKAPGHICEAVAASTLNDFEAGIAEELRLFQDLLASDESAAQIHAFFSERAVSKVPGLGKEVAARPVKATGVIGAGTMGTGITLALLAAGFTVTLVDRDAEALRRAAARVEKTVLDQVAKGRLNEDAAKAQLARLTLAESVESLADADLVIEAVFERMALKQQVFRELDAVVRPGAILATNTSFLDVDAIAAVTSRPGDVIGLHFFAPANIMRLLEIVRGKAVHGDVLATAIWLARKLGKLGVVSGVCDGFIANRLMARRGEAADALMLAGASPDQIDRVMTDHGFPMGPYRMMDLVGLDVVGWDRENSAGRTVQEILCEAGHWGQKTGSGYYEHASGTPVVSSATLAAIDTVRAREGISPRPIGDDEILSGLLDVIVNEGAKLVEEGIVYRAADIDMALIAGYGWPVYRGGPMFWGDAVGLSGIVERLKARIAQGQPITLSPLLERMAAKGQRFVRA
ncbi:3-hydroxyacyl-CoA dehydrogenase NAD-binding domain-containing protein [Novosphingobium bradum]|uniref:3-hydroxyacyl-CoA dehydrogenase NAD-binding domain-containing protein n=1 Tax=Novosphingobium bradum TaxID=1737444 RepID=A0ABV7IMZ1_9SPHN